MKNWPLILERAIEDVNEAFGSKDRVAQYREEGKSIRWIAETLGVSVGKVSRDCGCLTCPWRIREFARI